MLHLQFVSSPDLDMQGEAVLERHVLVLGRSKRADIVIEDPSCALMHIKLRVDARGVFVELGPKAQFFHVNGKKIAGQKLLKSGDSIRIGATEIKLVGFAYRPQPNLRELLEKRYLELARTSKPTMELLHRLEKEILALERDLHA